MDRKLDYERKTNIIDTIGKFSLVTGHQRPVLNIVLGAVFSVFYV